MEWDRDAIDATKAIPFFLRKKVRGRIETAITEKGRSRVTKEDVLELRQKLAGRHGGHGTVATAPDSQAYPNTSAISRHNPEEENKVSQIAHHAHSMEPTIRQQGNGKREVTQNGFDSLEKLVQAEHTYDTRFYHAKGCGGAAGCPLTLVNPTIVTDLIMDELQKGKLEEFLSNSIKGPVLSHHKFKASVAGCANCCSEPQIKDLGIIAQIRPGVSEEQCIECMQCVEICKEDAVNIVDMSPTFNRDLCLSCGDCTQVCPTGAIQVEKQGYAILIGGKLGRRPQLAIKLLELADEEAIRGVLRASMQLLKEEARSGERLGAVIQRIGMKRLNELIDEN